MPRFEIKKKSIEFTGNIMITEDNPEYIVVDTSRLEVKMRVEASLSSFDESYYLCYVQIVTNNPVAGLVPGQSNYYGKDVEGKDVELRWGV